MNFQFQKLRLRLLVFVLAIIIPTMIFLILFAAWEQRREARLQAQESALWVAKFAAMQQERLIANAHHLLMTLATLPEVRERNGDQCSRIFADILKKFPHYTNIAAVTPEGDIFCSGLSRARSVNISDRPYFQEAIRERRLGISYFLVGRMSGKPNITVAYPAFEADGPVEAVVFVGLDLAWLSTIAAQTQMAPQSVLTAIDENGTAFARYPDPKRWIGKATEKQLVKTIIDKKEGIAESFDSDGVHRLYGFAPLYRFADQSDLFISVGVPTHVAFAQSNQIFIRNLAVFVLAIILAGAGTWIGADLFVKRRLDALVEAARTLDGPQQDFASASVGSFIEQPGRFGRVVEEMKNSLQRATKRQADFAAMIAHDLRSPVHTSRFAASVLFEQREQLTEDQFKLVAAIQRGCDEAAITVKEFLDFTKFSAGYMELERMDVAVSMLIQKTAMRFLPLTQKKNLRLDVQIGADVGSIFADAAKVERLIGNLLSNAVKFTPEGGRIVVGANKVDAGVALWVKDSGVGISPTDENLLFSAYRQAASGRFSGEEGTGLGLLICKMIAESHGGRIGVDSELGKGSTFRVWFPESSGESRFTGTV